MWPSGLLFRFGGEGGKKERMQMAGRARIRVEYLISSNTSPHILTVTSNTRPGKRRGQAKKKCLLDSTSPTHAG